MHQNKVIHLLLLTTYIYNNLPFCFYYLCFPSIFLFPIPNGPRLQHHLASGVSNKPFQIKCSAHMPSSLEYISWGQIGFKRNQGEHCLSLSALYSGTTTVITRVNENEFPQTLISQTNDTQLIVKSPNSKTKGCFCLLGGGFCVCCTMFFEIKSCKVGLARQSGYPPSYPFHPPE